MGRREGRSLSRLAAEGRSAILATEHVEVRSSAATTESLAVASELHHLHVSVDALAVAIVLRPQRHLHIGVAAAVQHSLRALEHLRTAGGRVVELAQQRGRLLLLGCQRHEPVAGKARARCLQRTGLQRQLVAGLQFLPDGRSLLAEGLLRDLLHEHVDLLQHIGCALRDQHSNAELGFARRLARDGLSRLLHTSSVEILRVGKAHIGQNELAFVAAVTNELRSHGLPFTDRG